jgi:hypothetical protein
MLNGRRLSVAVVTKKSKPGMPLGSGAPRISITPAHRSSVVTGRFRLQVPFRNSKLTQVLQDSLCGSSKVLLVCQLSPEAASSQETLSSLAFASRAAQVELGQVRRAAVADRGAAGGSAEGGGGGGITASSGGADGQGCPGSVAAAGSPMSRGAGAGAAGVGSGRAAPGGSSVGSRLSSVERGSSPGASGASSPRLSLAQAKPARH